MLKVVPDLGEFVFQKLIFWIGFRVNEPSLEFIGSSLSERPRGAPRCRY